MKPPKKPGRPRGKATRDLIRLIERLPLERGTPMLLFMANAEKLPSFRERLGRRPAVDADRLVHQRIRRALQVLDRNSEIWVRRGVVYRQSPGIECSADDFRGSMTVSSRPGGRPPGDGKTGVGGALKPVP